MISSTLKVIVCLMALCLIVNAQNASKTNTSSISGKITAKGTGIAGVPVAARARNTSRRQNPGNVASTDDQGNYRLSNLAPGEYEVGPAAFQYVVAGYQPVKRLILAEGENLEGIDFTIIRGGAITGKVTDAEGRPVIEEPIEIIGPEGNPDPYAGFRQLHYTHPTTDDRGIYRVYGLPPGKYKIAAGTSEHRLPFDGSRRSFYAQTFHPSTNDLSTATVIEIAEGGEATNVDIVLRRSHQAFTVTARVVHADTGKPLPDVRIGLQKFRENGSTVSSGPTSNRLGEISLGNLTPGKYALFLDASYSSDGTRTFDAEPVLFEVIDQDLTNVVIKASATPSVSGVVVFEGLDQKARGTINGLMVTVHGIEAVRALGFGSSSRAVVNADGSFTASGVRPGAIQLRVHAPAPGRSTEFEVVRIERDGVVVPRVEMKEREDLTGLRLIVKPRTGGIRGVLKLENGQLSTVSMHVYAKRVGDDTGGVMSLELDDRGRFVSQPMAAGVYEITVIAYPRHYRGQPPTTKQEVVVADNQVSEVTLTLDLKPNDD